MFQGLGHFDISNPQALDDQLALGRGQRHVAGTRGHLLEQLFEAREGGVERGLVAGEVDAHEILKSVRGIAFTYFGAEDVVRHPLVQRIVNAYEGRTARLKSGAK